MSEIVKNILEVSKRASRENWEDLENYIEKLEENDEFFNLDEEDRAALIAILNLRANLEDKEKEPMALWRFIRYMTEIQMPLKIVDFTYMLFPGNEKYYANILTPTAFNIIQRQASAMLENNNYEDEKHKKWLEKIANGQMPYGYSLEMPSIKEQKEENEDGTK